MTPRSRGSLIAILTALALLAGWRVIGRMQAERYARDEPERALRWRPDDPRALLALAERQLAQGEIQAAQASARRLLAHEPLQGEAFRILAAASDLQGDRTRAFQLYEIAARRAPRDVTTRAWLAQRYLERGDYQEALEQIDSLLRASPQKIRAVAPVLVQLAQEPAFAEALAQAMQNEPPWRAGMLAVLRAPKSGNPVAAGQVMQALQTNGGLSQDEYGKWLDSLMSQGRWGEAYARWAGRALKAEGRLPLLYNGDFARAPSDIGFDWRRRRMPGVLLQFEPAAGSGGQIAYLQFIGRRVPNAGLEQALLLSPGSYRLAMRVRAQALRSAMGLQWQVVCAGPAGVVARGESIEGSFGWRENAVEVVIPQLGCPGQWLRLVNPVPSGAAQQVTGQLWVAAFTLAPTNMNTSLEKSAR